LLGVWIGNINVGVSGVADDVYLMSDRQSKLQAQLDIASHYGKCSKYGANKTKITVDNDVVKVVNDNENLGQTISGTHQETKNIDLRLEQSRKNLYSFLGAGFSYQCLLSPVLKLHIFRAFTCLVARSGLSSFALRLATLEPIWKCINSLSVVVGWWSN
jgi:hypothetical protein